MLNKQSTQKENFAKYLMIFIMIQPLLDLLTSFSLLGLNLNMTPGVIIRFFIMLVSAFYILFSIKEKRNKKYLYYLLTLAVFFLIHLGINMNVKEPFNLIEEITSIAKLTYFVVMMFSFILAFKDLRNKNKKERYFPMNVNVAVWIINIVMVIATITGTGIQSYNGAHKDGHSGWFFAANDLGTLLAIAFPVVMWNAISKTTNIKKVYYWIPVLLTSFSLFVLGTKVGFLSVIIGFGSTILGVCLEWIINRKKTASNKYLLNLIITVFLLGGTILIMPNLPAFTNTATQYQTLENQKPNVSLDSEKDESLPQDKEDNESVLDGVVYSGRDGFLKIHEQFYEQAPSIQKAIGMGYAGNYKTIPKIIERDFHDIYYQFGWLGFFLLVLPITYYGIFIVVVVIRNFISILSVKYTLIATSLGLGLGIAYLAGHTLTSPAVSTYLAIILSYLIVDLKIE